MKILPQMYLWTMKSH